jgi:hypothetical protein
MSPTIRIDEDVLEELKKHAEPFVDTPNSVLRRVLGLGQTGAAANGSGELDLENGEPLVSAAAGTRRSGTRQRRRRGQMARAPRAKTGSILAASEYEMPMLEIVAEHGGRAAAREVLDELDTRLDGQLTDVDRQSLGSGDIRWRNRAQFVRLRLVEQGDLVKDSPRGIWEITDQGRRRIKGAA